MLDLVDTKTPTVFKVVFVWTLLILPTNYTIWGTLVLYCYSAILTLGINTGLDLAVKEPGTSYYAHNHIHRLLPIL